MRSIEKTIQEIIAAIPETFSSKNSLLRRFNEIIDDSHYTAPEIVGLRWQELGELLKYYLVDYETEEWCKKVQAIIQGKQ